MVYLIANIVVNTVLGKVLSRIGNFTFSIMMLHFLAFKVGNGLICILRQQKIILLDFPTIPHNAFETICFLLLGISLPIIVARIYDICKKSGA